MAKEGDRASVFRTTKVRTAIRGDSSWIQRRKETDPEEEEKPWLAEVRANRLNGAQTDISPVSSPISKAPPPADTTQRGVFTKTEAKPASSTSTNGYSGSTTGFNKKPSEGYRKIAPHTVRATTDSTVQSEPQLSPEEVEKRTEAASGVIKPKAARQRSYVLSAAKKYESTSTPETSPVSSTSFVAKRVVISDDDADATTPTKTQKAEPISTSPTPPPAAQASEPEPPSQTSVTPVPEEVPLVAVPAAVTPVPEEVPLATVPAAVTPVPEEVPLVAVPAAVTPVPEEVPLVAVPAAVTPEPVPQESVREPSPEQSAETLSALSDTLISLNTEPTSPEEKQEAASVADSISDTVADSITYTKPVLVEETHTVESSFDSEPNPEPSDGLHNDDLITLAQSGEVEPEDPAPKSPGFWSQDLLSGQDSVLQPEKTSGALNLLADDVIPIDTSATSLSTDYTFRNLDDSKEPLDDTQGSTDTIIITTRKIVISDDSDAEDSFEKTDPQITKTSTTSVVKNSSTDPFEPIPIEDTSMKSPVELFDPLILGTNTSSTDPVTPLSPKNDFTSPDDSMSSTALVSLADDIIPIDTNTTRLITDRSWGHFDPQIQDTPSSYKSEEEEPDKDADEQQDYTVRFERKSSENDSPWDRWTSPTVYTTRTTEERDDDPGTQTVTTITTVREVNTEVNPISSTFETTEQEESPSTDLESKKGFVLLKEYVDESNESNEKPVRIGSDMSACTYCGKLVGSDAKITIEHLNISCHPSCFKCGICSRPMGDFLLSMFLHKGTVHCETCYANVI